MDINCLKCLNSACCKGVVEIDKKEYDHFVKLNLDKHFETRTSIFLSNNQMYKSKKSYFDDMYKNNFAILKKADDDYCSLLDQKTMLCTIYENRPSVCKDYTTNRCKNIRELCQ